MQSTPEQFPKQATWPEARALPLVVLAASGASVALALQLASLDSSALQHFLENNQLGARLRSLLLGSMLAAAAAAVLAAGGWIFRHRAHGWHSLRALADFCSPLVLAGALPALFNWPFGQQNKLAYLLLLTLVLAAAEPLVGRSLRSALPTARRWVQQSQWLQALRPHSQRLALGCVLTGCLAYSAHFSYYSIIHHQALGTSAFDLGIFDNTLNSALHGVPFQSTVMNGNGDVNILSCHAEYAMLAFVPLYALWPHAESLLVLQATLLGFAALPLFAFARKPLGDGLAVVLAFAYLLHSPLHGANLYDFHWLPLAIPFLFGLFWAIAEQRRGWTIALTIVLFSLREDIPLGLAVLGSCLLGWPRYRKTGLWLAVASVAFFVVNKFVVMPLFGKWWFQNIYKDLFSDGVSGYGSVVRTLVSNPLFALTTVLEEDKLVYALHMLAPLALLPIRRLGVALLLLPGCFFTLLTTQYPPTVSIAFQYTAHWIPYLFAGVVVVLNGFARDPHGWSKRWAAGSVLALGVFSHSYNFGAVLQHDSVRGGFRKIAFELTPDQEERYLALRRLVDLIPAAAPVAATETLTAHISNRVRAYSFRFELHDADYLLIRRSDLDDRARKLLQQALDAHDYRLVQSESHGLYLLEKGAADSATIRALRALRVRPRSSAAKPTAPATETVSPSPSAPSHQP